MGVLFTKRHFYKNLFSDVPSFDDDKVPLKPKFIKQVRFLSGVALVFVSRADSGDPRVSKTVRAVAKGLTLGLHQELK